MRITSITCVFLCLLASLPLLAQVNPQRGGASFDEFFKRLDRNGDGKLTRDEIPRLFEQLDKNKDSVVTREEAQAGVALRRPRATTQPSAPSAPAIELVRKLDLRYATLDGVDAKPHSLDVYAPKDAKNAPVIIFIHGGGWRRGDKSQSRCRRATGGAFLRARLRVCEHQLPPHSRRQTSGQHPGCGEGGGLGA